MLAQLVKLCMGRLEDKDKRDQKDKDPDLINEVRKHDLIGTLVNAFDKWHASNNVLTSTILECFKAITLLNFKEFYKCVLLHEEKLRKHENIPVVRELLNHVKEHEKVTTNDTKHQDILDDEKLEHYLNEADTKSPPPARLLKREGSIEKHLESLRELTEQIGKKSDSDGEDALKFAGAKE